MVNVSNWNSRVIQEQLKIWFFAMGIPATAEMIIGHKKSIDFGTDDGEFGIELKSSKQDLMSGYGLNQELFKYGFVLVPTKLIKYTIGHLIVEGYKRTGVLYFKNDDYTNKYALKCAYDAQADVKQCKTAVEQFFGGFEVLQLRMGVRSL